MHNAFLNIDNRKMSKSLGNFRTVREISEQYDLQVLRFFMLNAHYRSPLNFSADLMESSKNALERITEAAARLRDRQAAATVQEATEDEKKLMQEEAEFVTKFEESMDDDFNTYNINADDAACAIAEALNAEKLAFLTDIEGVYKDPKDPESLISELHVQEARDLITNGNVGGGMIPKLQGCIDAIENGVSRVHIMDGRIPHCLLLEIFTNKGIGTAILGENKEKFNHEDE